jgi:hypothetical protein
MLAFALSVASAAPAPLLPPEEERLEAASLEALPLEHSVPAWPDMRPFRRRSPDSLLAGLAIGAVGGILVASVIPDHAVLAERRFYTLSSCQKMVVSGLSVACLRSGGTAAPSPSRPSAFPCGLGVLRVCPTVRSNPHPGYFSRSSGSPR